MPKEISDLRKEISDLTLDALENLLRNLDATPPDSSTHPELCEAIEAARADLVTIRRKEFSLSGKLLSSAA